jgi:translocation and assembly module TamB
MARIMSPRQRRFWWAAAIVLGMGGGVSLGYGVATGTAAGRRWLLATLLPAANRVFGERGSLRIGTLREISPGRVVAEEVTLVDTAGVPVLTARRLVGTLDVRALFGRRIHIRHLALAGVDLTLRQESPGREWNLAHIIAGDTTVAVPHTGVRFGDDVRVDSLLLDAGVVTTRAPWAPHPMFVGAARDSVIAVRDSLHDIERLPDGRLFERRRIVLERVRTHDVVIVDPRKRPASLQLDSLQGVLSDPPVPIRHASGQITWTADSLRLDLRDVRLPDSRGSAVGMVGWHEPGPVRFDVLVKADAGLADLPWIWDVLPREGRGTASVRMRTLVDANDVEYALRGLDVRSGASRVRGEVAVIVRPADLLLHGVDLFFTPLRSDLARRLSYGALPAAVRGAFSGRLVARAAGSLAAFHVDTLDARFADETVRGGNAVSSVRLAGMMRFGERPRVWNLAATAARIDVRTMRALMPAAPPIDGVVTGSVIVTRADLAAADLRALALTWTDAAGNASTVRGDLRLGYAGRTPDLHAALLFDPLSMPALARVDSTVPLRSRLAGTVLLDGSLEALTWRGRLLALDDAATRVRLDSAGVPVGASLVLEGTASIGAHEWRGSAEGTVAAFDVRAWLGRRTIPSTAVDGTIRLSGRGPLDTLAGAVNDTTIARTVLGDATVAITQRGGVGRPGFDLVGSVRLERGRLVVDSALGRTGAMLLDARGALARDTLGVDTLQVSVRADSLDAVRGELQQLADMMQPVDSAVATSLRAFAVDTLTGDASLSGYLYGSVGKADATVALGARALQVGAIRVGRLFGSARASDVLRRPSFEGTANADAVTGVGAVRIQSATFRVADATPDSGALMLDVSSEEDAHLVMRGAYAANANATTVRLDSLRLAYDRVTWRSTSPAEVVQDSLGFRFAPIELRSTTGGLLAARADVPRVGTVQGELRVDRFPFGEVSALLVGTSPVDGTVSGRATLAGVRRAPLIDWNAVADSVGRDGYRLPPIATTGRYANRRLNAEATMRDTLGGRLQVSGQVPVDLTIGTVEKRLLSEAVQGRVTVDSLQLQGLPLRIAGVSRTRGVLDGAFVLGGTFDKLSARGVLTLADAGVRVDDFGIEPSNGRLTLRADADSLVLESFAVRSGRTGDTVGAAGVLRFAAGESPASVDLRITARNFVASRQRDGTDLDVGGTVRLAGPIARPQLSGTVVVPRANLVVDPLAARTALDLSSDAARALLGIDEVPVAETTAQFLSRLGSSLTVANARLELGNEVWVQTPESRVNLAGGLDVTMNGDRLALDGEIRATRGQYRLELGVVNRGFSVDSGRVRFYGNNAIAPTLDISATNVVRVAGGSDIPVRVHIGGTYDKPVLRLSSTDPLYASAPESEIISLLIFGAPTFALDGQSQSTVRAVTGILLPSVGGLVEGALQRWLPVNTIQVSTGRGQQDAPVTGTSLIDNLNLSISAGKQFGERTFLRLNTGICRGVGPSSQRGAGLWGGVAAEYRLARGWWGQVGVDPGSAPCTRPAGDVFPRLQFGFDLFREWIF